MQVVGFSNYARVLQPAELAGLDWDMVQGTNLQHALMVAGRFLDRHPDSDPVVLVVTDGEPTAHLTRDGRSVLRLAAGAGDAGAHPRRGGQDDASRRDAQHLHARATSRGCSVSSRRSARRNGGRVFNPDAGRLGDFVVSDFLRARRAMGARGRPRRAG